MSRAITQAGAIDENGFPIARACCMKCFRPDSHCVCSMVKPFHAHCNLLILQHPHERRKYYSTAKLVLASILNSRMLRGIEFDADLLQKELSQSNFYLLYPGVDSIDCESIELSEKDSVVVLDGTWSEAGKILYRNPILRSLKKVSFQRELKSEYKIRKQPKEKYLSTIESIGHLLKLNAACSGSKVSSASVDNYDQLFRLFSCMVDRQLAYFPRNMDSDAVSQIATSAHL